MLCLAQAAQGQILITLSAPPMGINITIDDPKITKHNHWKGFRLLTNTENIHSPSSQEPKPQPILIGILPGKRNSRRKSQVFVKSPNPILNPSRVTFNDIFPVNTGFAITVDKAQGQTLEGVIVALSRRDLKISNFTYACVYVANSRVKESERMRLLLKDMPNPRLQWETLTYLTSKKRCKSIGAFFSGFETNRSNWKHDRWDPSKALQNF